MKAFVIIALIVLLSPLSFAQEQGLEALDANKDTHLQKTILQVSPRVYLYDFLRNISKETGVRVSVDRDDPLASIPLCVNLPHVSLYATLQGIYSVLSCKQADISLLATVESNGTYSYRFLSSLRYRALASRLNAEMRTLLVEQIRTMIRIAYMTPEERKRSRPLLARVMLEEKGENISLATIYTEEDVLTKSSWANIRLFAEAVPQEQHETLVQGDNSIGIPFAQLPPEVRKQILLFHPAGKVQIVQNGKEVLVDEPEPTALRFYATQNFGKFKRINVTIMMGVETVSPYGNSSAAHSVMGFLDKGLRKCFYKNWILDGDVPIDTLQNSKKVAFNKGDSPYSSALEVAAREVLGISQAASMPCMAVIPNGDELPQPQNYGNTLQEVLESWKESYFLMSKWRNGVLLLHYPDWFYGDDAQVAYTQIQDLRQSAEKNRGFLPIPLIANTFTKLNTSQLWRLGAEFPVLPVAAQSPLFKLLQEQPSLLSETGVTLNPHSSEELKKRYTFLSLLGESYTALRIHQREVKTGGETLPMLFLEVKTNTGVWAPVVGTNLLPRDPDFASPKKTGKK